MASREPRVAWFDGRIVPFAEARVPIEDRGLQFGESLYEVIAITAGAPRYLDAHAERLRAGALALGIAGGSPSNEDFGSLAERLVAEEGLVEGLLIAQLTGGSAARAHLPAQDIFPLFFAYLRAFCFPRAAEVARGIAAVTHPDTRWARRDLKTTMLLPAVLAKRAAAERGAQEAIFVGDDGRVHEGASSNVFAVEGRRLVTPAQSESLLPGVTRPVVARLAHAAGLEVVYEDLLVERLRQADEVFVTSTTFTLMPVTTLDGAPVRTGPIAPDLAHRLRAELCLSDS